jgi:hypothetical protein
MGAVATEQAIDMAVACPTHPRNLGDQEDRGDGGEAHLKPRREQVEGVQGQHQNAATYEEVPPGHRPRREPGDARQHTCDAGPDDRRPGARDQHVRDGQADGNTARRRPDHTHHSKAHQGEQHDKGHILTRHRDDVVQTRVTELLLDVSRQRTCFAQSHAGDQCAGRGGIAVGAEPLQRDRTCADGSARYPLTA